MGLSKTEALKSKMKQAKQNKTKTDSETETKGWVIRRGGGAWVKRRRGCSQSCCDTSTQRQTTARSSGAIAL